MRVLHVINNLSSGGAEKLLSDLLPILKKDIQVELLLLNNESNTDKYMRKIEGAGITINILSNHSSNLFSISFNLLKFLKKNKYDIVHTHLFPAFYYIILSKIFIKGFNLVFTEHSTYNRRSKYLLGRLSDLVVYTFYKRVIAISTDVQEALIHRGVKKDRIKVVSNGIDLTLYRPVKVNEKKYTIGMAGRLKKPKNQETIIKSLKLIPDHIRLLLAGEGPEKEKLILLAEDLGVRERVDFLGICFNMVEFYNKIDIHINSSEHEGFGLAAVESMAMGIPTFGSNVPGLKEVISDGGELFEHENYEELAQLVVRLYHDEAAYQECSEKGVIKAGKYDIVEMSNSYIYIYKQIFQG